MWSILGFQCPAHSLALISAGTWGGGSGWQDRVSPASSTKETLSPRPSPSLFRTPPSSTHPPQEAPPTSMAGWGAGGHAHLRLECLSHRAAARMSQRRREPLLLL